LLEVDDVLVKLVQVIRNQGKWFSLSTTRITIFELDSTRVVSLPSHEALRGSFLEFATYRPVDKIGKAYSLPVPKSQHFVILFTLTLHFVRYVTLPE